MSVLAQTSFATTADGGIPPSRDSSMACDQAEFPILLRRYRLGLALFIASIAMLFVGFSSAYVVRRGIPTYDAATGAYSISWEPLRLPMGLLLLNSCLLLSASATLEVVRRKVRTVAFERRFQRGIAVWLNVSLLLGAGFLIGQGIAWRSLMLSGQLLSTGARTAFFYILSGTHALHALIGVLAIAVLGIPNVRVSAVRRFLAVDLIAWYLHSMTLLWIYLLCFLLFA